MKDKAGAAGSHNNQGEPKVRSYAPLTPSPLPPTSGWRGGLKEHRLETCATKKDGPKLELGLKFCVPKQELGNEGKKMVGSA
jgi:hypothetical protein